MAIDPRSNLADVLLTEGVRAAMAKTLETVRVSAVDVDDDTGCEFDVVDSSFAGNHVVLLLRRRP